MLLRNLITEWDRYLVWGVLVEVVVQIFKSPVQQGISKERPRAGLNEAYLFAVSGYKKYTTGRNAMLNTANMT